MNDLTFLPKNSVWIMYSAENSDPYFKKFVSEKTVVPAVAVLSGKEKYLILHSLDYENGKDFDGEILVYSSEKSLINNICDILKKLNYPSDIFLNYSDKCDFQTDVIGHGTYRFLHDNITNYYNYSGAPQPKFNSADEIIYFLMDSKTDEDIKFMKIAAKRALDILNAAFNSIRIGMTEKQILNLVHTIFLRKPVYFKRHGIVKEELSWEKELCPVVLVGKNLIKGGHSCASNTPLRRGDTIYFDFGVTIYLKNGKRYSSDIQRMGYVLNFNEKKAPKKIQNVFDTLVKAIDMGIKNMTPDKKGSDIDRLVRSIITDAGYPDYNHATGHPVGETAHSPGTSLSPDGHKRSGMFLRENGVYTVEPRIQIENGGSIEEMIRVTKNGGEPLCPVQKELYLIR